MVFKDMFLNGSEEDTEFMPIVPLGELDIEEKEKKNFPEELPLLVLRNTVLFPNVVLPITVAREKSVEAIEAAQNSGGLIGVVAQTDASKEDPGTKDLYKVGTVAKIVKKIKLPDGNTTLFIMGRMRFVVEKFTKEIPYMAAKVKYLDDNFPEFDKEFDALIATVKETAERIVNLSPNLPQEAGMMLQNIDNVSFLVHFVASNLNRKINDKQALLEINDAKVRVEKLLEILQDELQIAELKNEITSKTRGEIDKQQREYFLQQQMKSIREELGGESNDKEIKDLKKRAEAKKWPQEAKEAFEKDLERLGHMHPQSPEYSVVFNHVDLLLDLPWEEYTEDSYDLKHALKVLDKEHYGMTKIKDRILEYLAVLKLKGDLKSPILCFVGPPGVGKTSLGQSIAHAINRKFARLSLGGLHDESELRGHRKTYIGAMPGRIIQNIRKLKTSNPVFVLDEVDKVGNDFRGDPSSALLEILDPEQNNTFYDNYLELEYDLSKVLFVATANDLNSISSALRDRMEIIQLTGYSVEEKIQIAQKHLVRRQKEQHGLKGWPLTFSDSVLQYLIQNYTRESGVRELDRQIASVFRNVAKKVAFEEEIPKKVTKELLEDALGKPIYNNEKYMNDLPPGVVVGLAWTAVGGDILFIEANKSIGKGGLTLTGNLGDVMKESATTALSFIRANAKELGIDAEEFEKTNFHVHVPEGAVPKDGPSAGITMMTAFVSLLKGKKVKPNLAMTGEVTLRGRVLPVGGIKEKVLAAKRYGVKTIIMCEQNRRDIEEINKEYIKGLKFIYVTEMREVLENALMKK